MVRVKNFTAVGPANPMITTKPEDDMRSTNTDVTLRTLSTTQQEGMKISMLEKILEVVIWLQ